MFLIREVEAKDTDDLLRLASQASFINLPADRAMLNKNIQKSVQSFRAKLKDYRDGQFIFVLEDCATQKVIGSSTIIAQHGTPDEPHLYFSVLKKKKESKSIHLGFLHQVLRLGFDFDGPTEIGGLILLPEYRSHEGKLGRLLSFARFQYMAARRPMFRDHVLSELMPPFNDRGESPLWEEVGRKFTNMSYQEADRFSRRNKEFVTALFPEGDIYTCLLSAEARESIGQVGQATKPVQHMIEKIGFRYKNMIDPFDGGPHYWAKTSEITPVKKTKRVEFTESFSKSTQAKETFGILMNFTSKGIRATQTHIKLGAGKKVSSFTCSTKIVELLQLTKQSEAYFLENKIE